jgi:hypothetical protein
LKTTKTNQKRLNGMVKISVGDKRGNKLNSWQGTRLLIFLPKKEWTRTI